MQCIRSEFDYSVVNLPTYGLHCLTWINLYLPFPILTILLHPPSLDTGATTTARTSSTTLTRPSYSRGWQPRVSTTGCGTSTSRNTGAPPVRGPTILLTASSNVRPTTIRSTQTASWWEYRPTGSVTLTGRDVIYRSASRDTSREAQPKPLASSARRTTSRTRGQSRTSGTSRTDSLLASTQSRSSLGV